MDVIRAWALAVAGVVIFGVLMEMLMPDGDIKKYVRIVMGLFLVFAILSPIKSFSSQDFFASEMEIFNTSVKASPQDNDKAQQMHIIRTYKQNLSGKMALDIDHMIPNYDVDVRPEVEQADDKKYGEVLSVLVMAKPKTKIEGDSQIEKKDERAIIKTLSDKYAVDEQAIKIKILKR